MTLNTEGTPLRFLTLLSVVILITACSDFLTEEVRTEVDDSRIGSAEGFTEALNSAYTVLRSFYGTEMGMTITTFGTDTYTEGADGGYKYVNQYATGLDPSSGLFQSLWDNMYNGINITNAVVGRAETVEGLSEQIVDTRVAEARFLRAHNYFLLVQNFGPVHLTLEETQGVEIQASRTDISTVYDVIVEDLEHAIAVLPVEADQYGRATRPAAEHLLARVLLTRASSDAAQANDYALAAELAQNVIDNYNFRLLDDFGDVWAVGNEVNDEVIWSIQYSSDPLLNTSADGMNGNSAHLYFNMVYDELPGMFRTVEYGRPYRRFRPTEYTTEVLFAVEKRENDSRYYKTFNDTWYAVNPGTFTVNGVDVTFAVGDTAIYIPGYEMTLEEKQARPYTVITPSDYSGRDFPPLYKHMDPNRPDINWQAGERDFLAFRLAETYLIAAEALLLSGNPGTGVEYINEVRRRAAWPGQEENMEITSAELDLDFILDERGRELLGEQFRYLDLIRTGELVERVRAHNPWGAANVEDYHMLRPIPQTQIDRTEGGADAFPQNPGY